MTCTPAEIERKRKIAIEKLNAKKQKLSSPKNEQTVNTRVLQSCQQTNGIHNSVTKNVNQTISNQQFYGQNISGICTMISDSRFEVDVKYHEKLIELFKTIPSRKYNTENKMWNFDIQHYNLLMSKLIPLQPHVVIQNLPNFVLNLLNNKKSDEMQVDLDKIEPELLSTLMPFQKEGVIFGIKNNGRCLIADEMGLGKTLQALGIASYYKEDWPVLIVTTSSMRHTWEESIQKYLPSVPIPLIRYMSSGKDDISDAQVLIISYDLMTRHKDIFAHKSFRILILDESHSIKNPKAKCTIAAITLSKQMKRVILLSGTPALSRPSELYSQLSLIDDKFFGSFFNYSKRYCDGQYTRFGWDANGKSNLTELEIILTKKFMIRRIKNEVLAALPDKSREIIKLDVGLNRLSEKDRLNLSTLVDNYVESKAKEKHSALLALFSESARIKIPSVCLYIENLLKSDEKFLVFAHHQVMIDAICKILNKNNKTYMRIDGNTTPDQRKYFIKKFQNDYSCLAGVLSITAANAGITLTSAQLVLFAELHWNPSILAQAESRAHRIGQVGNVIIRYLLASGTVDDYIWPLLLKKQNVLGEVGLCKESFRDTTVSDQIICTPSNLTRLGTKDISDFFQKSQNSEQQEADDSLQEFFSNDDDELFANANIDF